MTSRILAQSYICNQCISPDNVSGGNSETLTKCDETSYCLKEPFIENYFKPKVKLFKFLM